MCTIPRPNLLIRTRSSPTSNQTSATSIDSVDTYDTGELFTHHDIRPAEKVMNAERGSSSLFLSCIQVRAVRTAPGSTLVLWVRSVIFSSQEGTDQSVGLINVVRSYRLFTPPRLIMVSRNQQPNGHMENERRRMRSCSGDSPVESVSEGRP